jgi:hypothetical protein
LSKIARFGRFNSKIRKKSPEIRPHQKIKGHVSVVQRQQFKNSIYVKRVRALRMTIMNLLQPKLERRAYFDAIQPDAWPV